MFALAASTPRDRGTTRRARSAVHSSSLAARHGVWFGRPGRSSSACRSRRLLQWMEGERVVDAPQNWIAAEPAHRPNMWVLLADGHGRADVLEKSYGLGELTFRSQLTALGLNVSDRSRANYTTTLYSLSTFLNGRPLAELGQDMALPADAAVPPAALRGNSVFGLLRSAGYEIDALDSGFSQVRLSSADHVIDVGPRNELEGIELAQTALGAVIDKVTGVNWAPQGERVLRQVQQLKLLAADASASPRFVFAHIPSPHVPYALDDTCAIRTDIDASINSLPSELTRAKRRDHQSGSRTDRNALRRQAAR